MHSQTKIKYVLPVLPKTSMNLRGYWWSPGNIFEIMFLEIMAKILIQLYAVIIPDNFV